MVSFSGEPTSSRPACGISESRQVKFHIQKWYSGNVEAANGCAATNGSNDLYNVGPPFTIAKLVNITSITMVYDTYNILLTSINYIVNGIYKPTYNWLAPHCNAAKTQHDPLSGSTKGVFFLFFGSTNAVPFVPLGSLGPFWSGLPGEKHRSLQLSDAETAHRFRTRKSMAPVLKGVLMASQNTFVWLFSWSMSKMEGWS